MAQRTTITRTVENDTPEVIASDTATTVKTHYFWEDFFVSKANQIIFSLLGIINLLILLRLFFLLLGANRTGFVQFLLNITDIFVLPFRGIFPSPSMEGSYFEAASVVAILVWSILAYILSVIFRIFSSDTSVD